MEAWDNFLVAQAGASAALLGLVFVGLSINLTKIIEARGMPNRAFMALALLLTILIVAGFLLIPGQTLRAQGIEILLLGLLLWLAGTVLEWRAFRFGASAFPVRLANLILFELAAIPYVFGAVLLLGGNAGGAYWIGAAVLVSLVKAVSDAWVLLVEVNR